MIYRRLAKAGGLLAVAYATWYPVGLPRHPEVRRHSAKAMALGCGLLAYGFHGR